MAPRSKAATQLALYDEGRRLQTVSTKAEKNLIAIGFFSPSSKTKRLSKSKTITFSRDIDGKRIDASVTIIPTATQGLPVTADQDKYLAFQQLVLEMRRTRGTVENPIGFTSAEILKLLEMADAGKNYKLIEEWLELMAGVLIKSQMGVYRAASRRYQTDMFHVFDRVVTTGKEMPDGSVADRNYVWLADWQLENINSSYLLPIQFDRYRRLKNSIAKTLVPHLRIWFLAARRDHVFEKRYDDLCRLLHITAFAHRSRIVQQLAPSLDELVEHEYLARWDIAETRERKGFKVLFYDADRFRRPGDGTDPLEVELAEEAPPALLAGAPTAATTSAEDSDLVAEMTRRGIRAKVARDLIGRLVPGQPVLDQLEYGDQVIAEKNGEIRNKAGFYVTLLRDNSPVPESFVSSRVLRLRQAAEQARVAALEHRHERERAYASYWREKVAAYVTENFTAAQLDTLTEQKRAEIRAADEAHARKRKIPVPRRTDDYVREALWRDLADRVPHLKTHDAFFGE